MTAGAAGVMSVIKLLLAMQEEVIPASRNFDEPNGQIDFVDSPVYVVMSEQYGTFDRIQIGGEPRG